jgi:hypothetical protein
MIDVSSMLEVLIYTLKDKWTLDISSIVDFDIQNDICMETSSMMLKVKDFELTC